MTTKGHRVFLGVMKMLQKIMVMFAQLCGYTKTQQLYTETTTQMLCLTRFSGRKENQSILPDETEGPSPCCLHGGEPNCSPWAKTELQKLTAGL